MTLKEYALELQAQYATGHAREHSYRPALQRLLEALLPKHQITNEPARIACGAPDFIITHGDMPVAFVETKDLFDPDLDGRRQHKEQFTRYKSSLDTVVFTDYMDFHLYEHGDFVKSVRIAEERGGKIAPIDAAWDEFSQLIAHLANAQPQKITSASRLSQLMAAKARLLKTSIQEAFSADNANDADTQNNELRGYYDAFRTVLIHDLSTDAFADIYAQTIVYGMFAARLHDPTPETFSRQEAAELIPKSNPFLRKVFQQIAGYDLDTRIAWIVDDLVGTFRAANVAEIMDEYQKNKLHSDPLIHFYEDFLAAYDPRLRDQRGVFYTPQPVVRYIVDAVDSILKSHFGLPQGLSDYSKIRHRVANDQKPNKNAPDTYERETHRVQILDPATGTGTFLAEVVNQIHSKYYAPMQGLWQGYVETHLLPRLHGFELMMAPYSIAHLKMDMTLAQTGYTHTSNKRFRIYLTNSLEEYHPDTGTLFGNYLATEATEANHVKRDTPVMVMLGNPPYSGESSNKGEWIMRLMEDYKKEPGGRVKLNERNPKWINDDYVKFIRMAHYFVERNGEGIVAFINPHGYLDNPTFRGMRWKLLHDFDNIYTLDLHGNAKKKETAPDGSKDDNVFDIMQGVSINIFVKRGKKAKDKLATVHHADLYGKRADKYETLNSIGFAHTEWQTLTPTAPNYFFVPKDFGLQEEYEKGFRIDELMKVNSMGIVTARDAFTIHDSKAEVESTIKDFLSIDNETARIKYKLGKDVRDWQVDYARKDLESNIKRGSYTLISYRPFDNKWTFYTGKTKGFHCMPRNEVMKYMLMENVALETTRMLSSSEFRHAMVTEAISDNCSLSSQTKERTYVFPLYLYPEEGSMETERRVNFDEAIYKKIVESVGGEASGFAKGDECEAGRLHPQTLHLQVFDYIYGVLHSPAYRAKYKEFLKIDFPRIPYPADAEEFGRYAAKGKELRALHLMQDCEAWQTGVTYPVAGDNTVEKPAYDAEKQRVYINTAQYFEGVPQRAWEFFIGGYQPAQKWLKDRKGRALGFEEICHYMRIIHALKRTDEIMESEGPSVQSAGEEPRA